ncbi:hypothetical protein PJK55_13685 [Exiguobacterium sp. MMG028]|uniref:hypothetical protein n=1 Tax=Exiguobacterium sp. MMG028 TaxID=3021979 RepID=UPI0022FEB787|nr:hypothetical protein [Exiguobacterium sp. MMG028]MDA5561787.1 hypothetical protein [Exiguobacterium sp. MMG028]
MQPYQKYPSKSGSHNKIHEFLEGKYANSYVWPVIWHNVIKEEELAYQIEYVTFEVHKDSNLNQKLSDIQFTLNPINEEDPKVFYLNFLTPAKSKILSSDNKHFPTFFVNALQHTKNTLEIVSNEKYNTDQIATIDIDYLWESETGEMKALEVTTFRKNLSSLSEAKRLLQFAIDKRFSKPNAYQLDFLSYVSNKIFNAKIYFVCVNTLNSTNEILPQSNVLWFELTSEVAQNMHNGKLPEDSHLKFCSIEEFLSEL